MHWHWLHFDQLTSHQLYQVLAERQRVFVLEQKCFYIDPDGWDQLAIHLLGYEGTQLCAYARVFPPQSGACVIGRVLTVPERRGQGLGRVLMKEALARIQKEFGSVAVEMSAQTHLERFYNEFGFVSVSESYLEDGIPHLKMRRSKT